MGLLRAYHFRRTIFKFQNLSQCLSSPFHRHSAAYARNPSNTNPYSFLSSFFQRPFSPSARFASTDVVEDVKAKVKKQKKPLVDLFREAVGLSDKVALSESDDECDSRARDLKQTLRKLEEELRNLKEDKEEDWNLKKVPEKNDGALENGTKPTSLRALFTDTAEVRDGNPRFSNSLRMEDHLIYRKLPPDMIMFARHLYKEGYFKNANFLPGNKFDISCFENSYGRDFIRFAAEQLGKDNREKAKWLSGSDLKKIALFGCPSIAKKNVFSAKKMRIYFHIKEDTVCSKCLLKESCKFKNQCVLKGDIENLDLAVVMRVIVWYALESTPPQLVVPEEIKAAVNRLMKEVVNLTRTASRDNNNTA